MARELGLRIEYAVQPSPDGLAQAFIIGRQFVGADRVALALGDNMFYGAHFSDYLQSAAARAVGATVFALSGARPGAVRRHRVRRAGKVLSLEEKPARPSRRTRSPACTSTTTRSSTSRRASSRPRAASSRLPTSIAPIVDRGAAARREASPRRRLARHRDARGAHAGVELHSRDRRAAGSDGGLPGGNRVPQGLHQRGGSRTARARRWKPAPTASICATCSNTSGEPRSATHATSSDTASSVSRPLARSEPLLNRSATRQTSSPVCSRDKSVSGATNRDAARRPCATIAGCRACARV